MEGTQQALPQLWASGLRGQPAWSILSQTSKCYSNFRFTGGKETEWHLETWKVQTFITPVGPEKLCPLKSQPWASWRSSFCTIYQAGLDSFVSKWNFTNIQTKWKQKQPDTACTWYILWLASLFIEAKGTQQTLDIFWLLKHFEHKSSPTVHSLATF